ncbi:hypothetical protein AB1E18_009953 [Capra hircus]
MPRPASFDTRAILDGSRSTGMPTSGVTAHNQLIPAYDTHIGTVLQSMLLEKLNSTVPCLLDNSTNLPEELTMSISYSAANYGLSDNLATSTPGTSDGDSPSHPYHHNFSPHFLHFVEQCTLCNPDIRPSASSLMNNSSFKQIKRHASEALPKFLHPVTPKTSFEGR